MENPQKLTCDWHKLLLAGQRHKGRIGGMQYVTKKNPWTQWKIPWKIPSTSTHVWLAQTAAGRAAAERASRRNEKCHGKYGKSPNYLYWILWKIPWIIPKIPNSTHVWLAQTAAQVSCAGWQYLTSDQIIMFYILLGFLSRSDTYDLYTVYSKLITGT